MGGALLIAYATSTLPGSTHANGERFSLSRRFSDGKGETGWLARAGRLYEGQDRIGSLRRSHASPAIARAMNRMETTWAWLMPIDAPPIQICSVASGSRSGPEEPEEGVSGRA